MRIISVIVIIMLLASPAYSWNIKKTFERSKKPDCWGWAFTFGQSKKLKKGCHN